jgi:hypothetical protein
MSPAFALHTKDLLDLGQLLPCTALLQPNAVVPEVIQQLSYFHSCHQPPLSFTLNLSTHRCAAFCNGDEGEASIERPTFCPSNQ